MTALSHALSLHLAGEVEAAETAYRAILAAEPDHGDALAMLGLLLADGPRADEAEALLTRRLERGGACVSSLHALGRIRARQGRLAEALWLVERAIEVKPDLAPLHSDRGAWLHRLGKNSDALAPLHIAVQLDPNFAAAHGNLAVVYSALELSEEAFASDLRAFDRAPQQDRAPIFHRLAAIARKQVSPDKAALVIARVKAVGLGEADVIEGLAPLLDLAGRKAEAQALRNALARRKGLVVRAAKRGRLGLLLLGAVGAARLQTRYLVDEAALNVFEFEMLSPDQPDAPLGGVALDSLRQTDVVFNLSSEVEQAGGQFSAVNALCAAIGRPVLNPVSAIARTGREGASALFAGVENLVVPRLVRLSRQEACRFALDRPLLFRPAGDHGGEQLYRVETEGDRAAALARIEADAVMVSDYVDYASPDGFFRKFRLIFIDRQVHPYHLAACDDWLSHYWRARTGQNAAKRAEEEAFLADWEGYFGRKAAAAARAVAARLDLDFGGMDCALSSNGDLILFEANASFLLHLDEDPALYPYKHRFVPNIRQAFTQMVRDKVVL